MLLRILGLPNRWFIAVAAPAFCVVVEIGLNAVGQLTWDWQWWNVRAPWLIVVFGYLMFLVVGLWGHDMPSVRRKAAATVAAIFAVDASALAIFAGWLRWI